MNFVYEGLSSDEETAQEVNEQEGESKFFNFLLGLIDITLPNNDGGRKEEILTTSKTKRTPMFKLTSDLLLSEKGLPYIEKNSSKICFSDSSEARRLRKLIDFYETWGKSLYPKYHFEDLLKKIDTLSTEPSIHNYLGSLHLE